VTTLESDSIPSDVLKVVDLINASARTIARIQAFPFLRKTGTIATVAKQTGTAFCTANSKLAVVLGLTPQAGHIGRLLSFGGNSELYRVRDTSFSGSSIYEMDLPWTGETSAAAITVSLAQDRYPLPNDFDRPFADIRQFITSPHNLEAVDIADIHRIRAAYIGYGTPTCFSIETEVDGVQTLVLDPIPDEVMYLRFDYLPTIAHITGDTEKLPLPLRVEDALVEAVAYVIKQDQQNDLQGAQLTMQDYLQRLMGQNKPTLTTPRQRITPDTSHRQAMAAKYNRFGRIDWGEAWDRSV